MINEDDQMESCILWETLTRTNQTDWLWKTLDHKINFDSINSSKFFHIEGLLGILEIENFLDLTLLDL